VIDLDALRELVRQIVREELARRPTSDAPELLTIPEAAEHARVIPGTIRRWIRAGRLASTGEGKLLRVRRVDLDAVLAGGAEQGVDEIAERILRRRAGRKVLDNV
jgi:excisionase family DNA binding protein